MGEWPGPGNQPGYCRHTGVIFKAKSAQDGRRVGWMEERRGPKSRDQEGVLSGQEKARGVRGIQGHGQIMHGEEWLPGQGVQLGED